MPDSDIEISAGSGTKVDTRTVGAGSDEHRQVVVLGDPATASAVASVTAANGLAVDVTRVTGTVTVAGEVTNAGTFAVQVDGAALTSLQLIDNLVLAEDAAHASGDPGVAALAVRRDSAAVSGQTDGDYSTLNVDATGRLWCNVSNTVTVTGAGGSFPVTDSGGTLTVDAPVGTPVFVRLSDGSAAIATLPVSLASVPSHAVTNAGTFAVQVDGAALTALQLIDDAVFADEAAFTLASNKVLATGGYSVAHGSAPDALAAGGVGIPVMNRHRVPFVIGGHPNVVTLKHTTITTAVADAAIITVSAGTKIVVTGICATLDNASTVFPTLLVGFGATNTPTTTGVILAHGGVPAGGGVNRGDGSGIIGVGADNEDLRVTTTGNATGNGLQIVVTYYLIES